MSKGIFFIIFGIFWFACSAFGFIAEGSNIAINVLCLIAGILLLIAGDVILVKSSKNLKALKNGKDGFGTFISYQSLGNNLFSVIFSYTNEKGETKKQTSEEVYYFYQVRYFQKLKQFKIKYTDKYAIIVEPHHYDQYHDPIQFNELIQKTLADKKTIYVCPYCGNIQEASGKCSSCGARVIKNKSSK